MWSRVPPEKLTGLQLAKKFATFYGTRNFSTAFTSTCPCPEPDKSSQLPPFYFFKISFSIILSSIPRSWIHMSLFPLFMSWQMITPSLRPCEMLSFLWRGVLSTSSNPRLADHPLLAVRNCLFNIFTAAIHIWRPFLELQPENTPALVTGTHLSREDFP